MKHIAIDYHFVRDLVQSSELRVVHVSVGDCLLTPSPNLYLNLDFFICVTRSVLFLAHHLEGAYYSIFNCYYSFVLVLVCVYIYIYIYIIILSIIN